MSENYFKVDTSVCRLECEQAWNNLTLQEKLYAYHLYLASWEGCKICYFQRSYESPGIFLLLQELFSIPFLKQRALQLALTEEDLEFIKAYATGIFTNCGNYLSSSSTKFVPQISKEKFQMLIESLGSARMVRIWHKLKEAVYDLAGNKSSIDFPDKDGVTSYYSSNITSRDAELVKRFLISKDKVDLHWNSRLWKVDGVLEVKIPSNLGHSLTYLGDYEFEGQTIRISNGDFSSITQSVARHISNALPYCANSYQENMLAEYIKHFVSGEINYHKNSQREWIKDKGPVIETNIGFIENYVDPLNIRSEFEGFVSCVDKITSQKYTRLVSRAEEIVAKLPWGPAFEKDLFLKPDFTSLIVLTFAGPSIPIGINIPNYDDIRQHEGFKNVDLANAYPKVTAKSLQFLTSEDANLIEAVYHTSETLSTALHELLGHGSGKLLSRNTHGDFNFDVTTVNPAIGTLVDSWYEGDESWSSKFVELSGPYEECRAETVALYLACFPEPYEAFGIEDVERNRNAIWLYMIYSGIKGMRSYKPENNKWGQSHCWARYVILRVLLEVDNFINFEFLDNGLFELRVDYTKISSAGFQAISNFLTKLGCFKATGDVKRGRELFAKYSEYDDTMLRIRQIVIDNIRPRECDLQCHFVFNGREPILINFEETFDGVIQSFQQRYPRYDEEMLEQWEQEYEVNHN